MAVGTSLSLLVLGVLWLWNKEVEQPCGSPGLDFLLKGARSSGPGMLAGQEEGQGQRWLLDSALAFLWSPSSHWDSAIPPGVRLSSLDRPLSSHGVHNRGYKTPAFLGLCCLVKGTEADGSVERGCENAQELLLQAMREQSLPSGQVQLQV